MPVELVDDLDDYVEPEGALGAEEQGMQDEGEEWETTEQGRALLAAARKLLGGSKITDDVTELARMAWDGNMDANRLTDYLNGLVAAVKLTRNMDAYSAKLGSLSEQAATTLLGRLSAGVSGTVAAPPAEAERSGKSKKKSMEQRTASLPDPFPKKLSGPSMNVSVQDKAFALVTGGRGGYRRWQYFKTADGKAELRNAILHALNDNGLGADFRTLPKATQIEIREIVADKLRTNMHRIWTKGAGRTVWIHNLARTHNVELPLVSAGSPAGGGGGAGAEEQEAARAQANPQRERHEQEGRAREDARAQANQQRERQQQEGRARELHQIQLAEKERQLQERAFLQRQILEHQERVAQEVARARGTPQQQQQEHPQQVAQAAAHVRPNPQQQQQQQQGGGTAAQQVAQRLQLLHAQVEQARTQGQLAHAQQQQQQQTHPQGQQGILPEPPQAPQLANPFDDQFETQAPEGAPYQPRFNETDMVPATQLSQGGAFAQPILPQPLQMRRANVPTATGPANSNSGVGGKRQGDALLKPGCVRPRQGPLSGPTPTSVTGLLTPMSAPLFSGRLRMDQGGTPGGSVGGSRVGGAGS